MEKVQKQKKLKKMHIDLPKISHPTLPLRKDEK